MERASDTKQERANTLDRKSSTEHELALIDRAEKVLPGGTFGNIWFPIVIREGKGSHVWDESGNEYVDYLLGSGPMLVGHAHPEVVAAVVEQVAKGTTFFANNRHGILLAEAIVDAVACADQVRFGCSGTDADFYAMRLARAFTGREKLLKFEGGYHGMSDYALMSLAPSKEEAFPTPIPDSPGIPRSVEKEVIVAPFNDAEMVVALIRQYKDELAGVMVEPFQRLIPPVPGFLETLREVTAEHRIPLIFDEVVTGFRFAYGGAQEYFGVVPDICTLGKACGGGFPLSAVAGRADIMAHFDRTAVGEDNYVKQVGTLSANPVAAVAGLTTLNILKRPDTYKSLFGIGQELMSRLHELVERSGLKGRVIGAPPVFDVMFGDVKVRNYRDTLKGDNDLYNRFGILLRNRGILKNENRYYVSIAHTKADIEYTSQAWEDALKELVYENKRRS